MHTQHAQQLIFTHFYTEQRQHTIDADEGKPVLDEQQELNSIFECSSSEIHANAAQVSITREILPCMCTMRMHVHNETNWMYAYLISKRRLSFTA